MGKPWISKNQNTDTPMGSQDSVEPSDGEGKNRKRPPSRKTPELMIHPGIPHRLIPHEREEKWPLAGRKRDMAKDLPD